jgi:CelD/BcsL family acetyltransferase involved in cellulose biosynthesis
VAEIAASAVGQRLATPRAHDAEVGIYEDFGSLHALAPAWDRLARTPMQQSIWAHAWAETLGKGYSLRVSTAGPPDDPSAIVPLVSNGRGPTRFELLGSDLYEPVNVLGADKAGLAAIARELAHMKAPLLLRRVPAASAFVSAVCKAYAGSLVVVRRAAGTPYLPLDEGWLEPERAFSSMHRSDLRRARQGAEALGAVTVEILSPGPDQVGGLLEETLSISSPDPIRDAFLRRYGESAARRGMLRLCFLRIGGRTAASQLAVEFARRFWLLRHAYDRAFSRCAPDKLLMLETVRFAVQKGLQRYELLGGPQALAGLSTERAHEAVSVRTYTPGFSGLGALAADGANLAGRGWRALKHRA